MVKLLKSSHFLVNSFLNLIYPSICLHCSYPLEGKFTLLCNDCFNLIDLIDSENRCQSCFKEVNSRKHLKCEYCIKSSSYLNQIGSACEYIGPIVTLVRSLKYQDQPHIAKSLAAIIVTQFFKLKWPIPDLIVPVPMPWLRKIDRGYNQSSLIAHHVGDLLERPKKEVLKRFGGEFSQAGLSRKQRQLLPSSTFHLKKNAQIADQCILLIDDVMTTGSTLNRCAEALQEGLPKAIYGLTVCKA